MGNLTGLPPELGSLVAHFLSTRDAINLACTSRALLDIGEARSWRDLRVNYEGSPLHLLHLRTIGAAVSTWRELGAAVARRPARRSYIGRLRWHLTPQSTPLLLDLLAPPSTVTCLRITRAFVHTGQSFSETPVMQTLARAPRLDSLTHFTVVDRTAKEVDVYACLANMPNLVSLNLSLGEPEENEGGQVWTLVKMKGDTSRNDIQTGDKDRAVSSTILLPKLKRLLFDSLLWLDPLVGILDHAPIVEHLRVVCDARRGFHEGPDVEKTRGRDELAVRVLQSSTITSFDANDGIVQLIFGDAALPLSPDWMPNMTRMSCWGPVSV